MTTFGQALADLRAQALAAEEMRDRRLAREDLIKAAAKKKAPGLAARLLAKLRPAPDPLTQTLRAAKTEQLSALQQYLTAIPRSQAAQRRFLASPGGIHVMKQIQELQSVLTPKGIPVKAILGLGAALGVGFGSKEVYDRYRFAVNEEEIAKDPKIPTQLRGRAREMFKVLRRYAPSIAKDPTVSKDFARNLVRHEAIDQSIVKDLITAEKTYQEAKGKKVELLKSLMQTGTSFAAGAALGV